MKLFLDITRIATRVFRSAPTGIDRVEYAYATEILRNHKEFETVSVITTPLFSGALRPLTIEDILHRVALAWRLDLEPMQDPVYRTLKAEIEKPLDLTRPRSMRVRGEHPFLRAIAQGHYPVRAVARAPRRLDRWLVRSQLQDRCYLNTSHTQLEMLKRFMWTASSGTKCCFFIHDLIPIDYPEFVSPAAPPRHAGRMATVAKLASGLIVNSDYTRRSVERYLSAQGLPVPEIKKVPLGVSDWFLGGRKLAPPTTSIPYFVAVSTIEPRKNFVFLFAVWRRLVEQLGSKAPRLVVVGHRGWECENAIDVLERSKELGPYLIEATDLTDGGLASLLRGAQGLVAPSSVEGFGLPIAEALSLGVPILASDIEAHREVAGELATYLDPIDGPGWCRAVADLLPSNCNNSYKHHHASMSKIKAQYKPRNNAQHVGEAAAFISTL